MEGDGEAVARTGVDFDDFFVDFVFGAEDEAGEVGVAPQVVDDDFVDGDGEGLEDHADEFVGEGAFVSLSAQGHGDGAADEGVDGDDEDFFGVAEEDGDALLFGGGYSHDLHGHGIEVHSLFLPCRAFFTSGRLWKWVGKGVNRGVLKLLRAFYCYLLLKGAGLL